MSNHINLLPIVVLAGGLATRMKPLTEQLPKSLLPCGEFPFLHHQLELFVQQGCKEVYLCVGRFAGQIRTYLSKQFIDGLNLTLIDEGEHPLGTGAALVNALPKLPKHFFLCYGDSYLLCDFLAVQQAYYAQTKPALMTVYENNNRLEQSNLVYASGKIIQYSKVEQSEEMKHIDYGLSVFDKDIFSRYNNSDLVNIFQDLLRANLLAAFEVKQPFYEVGSFHGFERFKKLIKESKN